MATDDEEEKNSGSFIKQKLKPLFKQTSTEDASFEDFKILSLLGKGTFGKVRNILIQ